MLTELDAALAVPDRESSFLRRWVQFGIESSDCNLAYHLLGGLILLAQSAPKGYEIPFFGSPLRPSILFGLIIGGSTNSRKTAAVDLAAKAMAHVFPDQVGDAPGSVEGLIDALEDRPQQVIFFPEFASFLAQAENKGYFRPLKSKLTEAYDGTPLSRRRANGRVSRCAEPNLAILAAIATGYLESHAEPIDFTEGYLARHLTLYCVRERERLKIPEVGAIEQMRAAAYRHLASAMEWRSGKVIGRCRGLTGAADSLWQEWQRGLGRKAEALDGPERIMVPALARAPAMVMKVAGLLAWDFGSARQGGDWQIGTEEVLYATRIVDLHVRSVVSLGQYLTTDKDMRDRRRVMQVIAEGDHPLRFGEICKRAGLLRTRAKLIVETLLEEQTIQPVDVGRGGEPVYALAAHVH